MKLIHGVENLSIFEDNRISINELEFTLNWEEKRLKEVFPYEPNNIIRPELFGKKSSKLAKIVSLFFILLLSTISLAFIPLETLDLISEDIFLDIVDLLALGISSVYIFLFISCISNRYKKMRNEDRSHPGSKITKLLKSVKISDFIPLMVIIGFSLVYNSKTSTTEGTIFSDPITYFINYSKSINTEAEYISEIGGIIVTLTALYAFIGFCILIIYEIWIKSPDKLHNYLSELLESKITIKTITIGETTAYKLEKEERRLLPTIKSRKEPKIKCTIDSITPDTNLPKLWKILNPYYLLHSYFAIFGGLFFSYMGLSLFDNLKNNPEFRSVSYASLFWLFVLLISICFILAALYAVKNYVINPIWNYYRIKRLLIREIEKRKQSLYLKLMSRKPSIVDISKILFLNDCLEKKKRVSILPIEKPILSLLLLIPLFSQFFTALSLFFI